MRNIIRSINALLAALNITILAIIVACVTWQVAARFIFTSPSIFTDELSRLLFICLGLFGGAYTCHVTHATMIAKMVMFNAASR
ncbi:TRAP transporter small permease, partial [Escherichia sp. HC-TM1]